MTPPDSHADPLAELRQRWEAEPGSRLFLQLAEEYRRAGRHREALEVLEKGLAAHPGQVSGLVSLGRIHLALEQPTEAAAALEKAVDLDPTNPMALKLATEAHLAAGDPGMARQRLDLYKLLNTGDEDVDRLEARVDGRGAASETPAGDTVAVRQPFAEAEGSDDAAESSASEPAETPSAGWSPTAAWPALPSSPEVTTPISSPVEAAQAADAIAGGYASELGGSRPRSRRPDPFGDLVDDSEERRYLEGLAAEGLFEFEAPPEPEPELEPEPESDFGLDAETDATPDWEAGTAAPIGFAAQDAAHDEANPVPLADFDSVEESPVDAGLDLPPAGLTGIADTAPPAAASESPRPTVTLGQLYLDQGHHAEALAIFEAVLEREPGHAAAEAGRRAALAGQAGHADPAVVGPTTAMPSEPAAAAGFSLTADDLLRGSGAGDPTSVKRHLLTAYLERLRGHRAS